MALHENAVRGEPYRDPRVPMPGDGPGLIDSLKDLSNSIERLHAAIATHRERVAPILSPVAPKEPLADPRQFGVCPLAGDVQTLVSGLNAAWRDLEQMTAQVRL